MEKITEQPLSSRYFENSIDNRDIGPIRLEDKGLLPPHILQEVCHKQRLRHRFALLRKLMFEHLFCHNLLQENKLNSRFAYSYRYQNSQEADR